MRRSMLTKASRITLTPPPILRARAGISCLGTSPRTRAEAAVIIDSEIGFVAVLSIGMAVSCVVPTVQKGESIAKGQEISYFQFGGSDVVMVFEKSANVRLDQEEIRCKVGSRSSRGVVRE